LQAELQNNVLSGSAQEQVHTAAMHMRKLAEESEKSLRQLFKGVETLNHASDILKHLDKITVEED
jgi:hypothetical protein